MCHYIPFDIPKKEMKRQNKQTKTRRNKEIQCEKCGHIQSIKKDKVCSNVVAYPYPNIITESADSMALPICAELRHNGFWITDANGIHVSTTDEKCTRNSVMLRPECLLYVYKLALRHLLLTMDVIQPSDIDPQNLVPHVMVRKNPTDSSSKYNQIQNEKFFVDQCDLSVKNDFLMIELDKKRDLHMTLIFAKGISKKINLAEAFTNIIKLLNHRPDLIESYSSLEYFGQKEIEYWHETKDSYPDNVRRPHDYIPPVVEVVKNYSVTSAGSVIRTNNY